MPTVAIEMYTEECCSCGIPFSIPTSLRNKLRDSKELFYCPQGHPQHYTGTTHTQQLEEANRRRQMAEAEALRLRSAVVQAEDAAAKAQRAARRLRKRVAAGVCPCCTRTFTNLARHMASKHPQEPGVGVLTKEHPAKARPR